jgi:pimeloyl-ACP methyl ester carboxylesterase
MTWVEAGSGPPLVLLHGYGGSAHWWLRNVSALARVRRVYAMDVPGFGRSRLRARFTFAGAADLLARWMEQQDIAPADVLGHSMGGQLAMILAARQPHHVRALVLAAPAGVPFEMGLSGIALRALRSRRGGDPHFTSLVLLGVALAGPLVLWHAVQQIRFVDVRAHVAAIRAPTLILWGERDTLLLPATAPVLAAAIADARLTMVPGGRHNLMWEQPMLFNKHVTAFLEGLPQTERSGGWGQAECCGCGLGAAGPVR